MPVDEAFILKEICHRLREDWKTHNRSAFRRQADVEWYAERYPHLAVRLRKELGTPQPRPEKGGERRAPRSDMAAAGISE